MRRHYLTTKSIKKCASYRVSRLKLLLMENPAFDAINAEYLLREERLFHDRAKASNDEVHAIEAASHEIANDSWHEPTP